MDMEQNQNLKVQEIVELIKKMEFDDSLKLALEDYHDNDIADALAYLSPEERRLLYHAIGPERTGEVFSYLEDDDKIVASYIDHNNQVKSLHIRVSNFPKGGRILLVDNWIDTAATMQTCLTIIEEGEGVLAGIATLGAAVNDATRGMLESGQIRCIVKKV